MMRLILVRDCKHLRLKHKFLKGMVRHYIYIYVIAKLDFFSVDDILSRTTGTTIVCLRFVGSILNYIK